MTEAPPNFAVDDLVRMANDETFQGRVLRTTVGPGEITYQVSFDMTFGPDRVVWMKPEHLVLVKAAVKCVNSRCSNAVGPKEGFWCRDCVDGGA